MCRASTGSCVSRCPGEGIPPAFFLGPPAKVSVLFELDAVICGFPAKILSANGLEVKYCEIRSCGTDFDLSWVVTRHGLRLGTNIHCIRLRGLLRVYSPASRLNSA